VLARPILQRRPALVVVAWVFFFGAVAVAPLALGETWVPRGVGVGPWLALAWILVFPTVIAYLLNLWALARVEATTVAIFVCLQPLLTAVLAWAMLGERLEPASAAMGALVLAGVWCVAGGRKAAA
jgi:drug/metabolite transporter (DMT)-like permease